MPQEPTPGSSNAPAFSPIPADQERFLSGTGRRINRSMLILAFAGVAICWMWRGAMWAGGFAAGALLSALNFHWLTRAVSTIAEQAAAPGASQNTSQNQEQLSRPAPRRRSTGLVLRVMLRYALIGLIGYVIFKSSLVSLSAFFIGLFLFLGAILIEMTYEVYSGFRGATGK